MMAIATITIITTNYIIMKQNIVLFFNKSFASCSLINLDFFLLHTAHFDINIVLPLLFGHLMFNIFSILSTLQAI